MVIVPLCRIETAHGVCNKRIRAGSKIQRDDKTISYTVYFSYSMAWLASVRRMKGTRVTGSAWSKYQNATLM